ncbi:TAXI family TRAP transporter solute-binding subunit [Orrella sp. JC864]|uniref:TAXI family TRAP transporter solute-binding subunit n=1 Tax=Orrella sp. JC864 TaxID=3120298 RepID=UPI00300A35D9
MPCPRRPLPRSVPGRMLAGWALGLCLAWPAGAWAHFLSIGTGDAAGVYYAAGEAICRQVNRERVQHGVRCTAQASGGSVYNARALGAGDLDLGMVQSDVGHHAYRGSAPYQDAPLRKLRTVLSLHAEPLTLVARADAGINALDDLRGKRVNAGNPGSGSRATLQALLQAKDWTLRTFSQTTALRPDEHGAALCEGRIDGLFYAVGHPSRSVADAIAQCGARLLDIDGPAVERLLARHPYYARAQIPGGLYAGNPRDTRSFGTTATLMSASDVPDELVYLVVKAIFENLDAIRRAHPALAALRPEQMAGQALPAPLHPGAEKYYREQGWLPRPGQGAAAPAGPTGPAGG